MESDSEMPDDEVDRHPRYQRWAALARFRVQLTALSFGAEPDWNHCPISQEDFYELLSKAALGELNDLFP